MAMSLSEAFSKTQTNAFQKQVDAACAKLCSTFARDRKILQERANGTQGLLGSWRSTRGEVDAFNKKITYLLLSDTQAKSPSFDVRMEKADAIKKQLHAAIDACGYMRALHAACARKDVNVRVEIEIDDHFVANGMGTSYRQVDVKAVIHLGEPYARSSQKLTEPPPPPKPPEAQTRTVVVEKQVRDVVADNALRAVKSKDAATLAATLREHGWSSRDIAALAAQAPVTLKRLAIQKRGDQPKSSKK